MKADAVMSPVRVDGKEVPTPEFVAIQYQALPTACDLAVSSLLWALDLLKPVGWCDLRVHPGLSEQGQRVLDYFGDDCVVTGLKADPWLRPHEWYVEASNGRRVGALAPS